MIGGLVTVGVTDIIYAPNHGKNATDNGTGPQFNSTHDYFNHELYGHLILGETDQVDDGDKHTPTQLLMGDILIVCAQVGKYL